MLKALAPGLLLTTLILSVTASDNGFANCNCDDEGFWSIHNILECQKVSDLLIAVAYFSIPIELLYFISCSNVPFKWVLLQFIAFIVLCGLTHLLNVWTYYGPHSFQLMLALTISKFLTALVSCATVITLLTLIPLLLKVKVRELFLKQNVLELDQEVGMMKKQKEASWHVRMLTHEIRKSLDKHTILYTTLVELSKTLDLHNCAVWMPNENRTMMNLTHELKVRNSLNRAIAAIRMPMLRVSNFKGGTPELVETCYAILVLVLPFVNSRTWTYQELEIVEVVADQVAVALSHAAVLEESQLTREKLGEQNRALQQAKENAMMASQARNSFQKVMSHGLRRPMHSILGLLSMFQDETMSFKQKICLCVYKGFGFAVDIRNPLPDQVIGDEKRTFQVVLHMVGYLLNIFDGSGSFIFRVSSESGSDGKNDKTWGIWRPDEYACIKFEIEISDGGSLSYGLSTAVEFAGRKHNSGENKEGLSFSMCKKLVQMMQGNIWISSNPQGLAQSMTLVLKFQLQPSFGRSIFGLGNSSEQPNSNSMFRGLRVILADDDNVNRTVTKKLLERLGCQVSAVSSGFECLSVLSPSEAPFQIILLDLQMPEMDGFEVAKRIRKFRSRSWPLIIALTASADEHLWERCIQVGMNGIIRKPVLLQGMADELRRVLKRANDGV
ncbi:unnamed protein product, partial [Vitis vinifera]